MGALTLRMLLVLTLAVMTECGRPLQSSHMSSLVMSMLQTPPKPLQPPPLSPIQREQMFQGRKPPSPTAEEYHRGYRFGSTVVQGSATASSSKSTRSTTTSPTVDMNQVQYSLGVNGGRAWGFQLLHKNPAGPNPIGNEFRPGNSKTVAKKNRYPPPYGG
ncbi:hypothetical protein Mapa_003535 [Marchantia paleacea]|nr:hypothetical protein Mapa_003535 [Marchantia paleacea]